jgi:hypothetical protein
MVAWRDSDYRKEFTASIRLQFVVVSNPRVFVSPANRRCSDSDAKSYSDIAANVDRVQDFFL